MKTDKQLYDQQRYQANRESIAKRTDAWRRANLDRQKEYRDRFHKNHPEAQRWFALKSRYGISAEQYQAMLESQNGVCAICQVPSEKTLSVDHNHTTNEVRALLCQRCNVAVGFIEQVQLKEKAEKYLARFH